MKTKKTLGQIGFEADERGPSQNWTWATAPAFVHELWENAAQAIVKANNRRNRVVKKREGK